MSTPHVIMWACVLVVGLPAAWRNPTAGALVLCWIVVEIIYLLTGDNLAVQYYLYPDIAVIAVIMAKAEQSTADHLVLLIFPVMWVLYLTSDAMLHSYYRWWALWGLAIVQFLASGWESLSIHRRASHAASDTPAPPPGDMFRRLIWGGASG